MGEGYDETHAHDRLIVSRPRSAVQQRLKWAILNVKRQENSCRAGLQIHGLGQATELIAVTPSI
jgi:hypothetical protein